MKNSSPATKPSGKNGAKETTPVTKASGSSKKAREEKLAVTFFDANKTYFEAPDYADGTFTTTDLEHMSDMEFYQIVCHLWNNPPVKGHYTLTERVDWMNVVLREAESIRGGPGRIEGGYPYLTIVKLDNDNGDILLTLVPRAVVEAEKGVA